MKPTIWCSSMASSSGDGGRSRGVALSPVKVTTSNIACAQSAHKLGAERQGTLRPRRASRAGRASAEQATNAAAARLGFACEDRHSCASALAATIQATARSRSAPAR